MHSVIKIQCSLNQVWHIFTDITTWKTWWGAEVKSISPGWRIGATVTWASGGGTTVFDFEDKRRVGLVGSYGEKVIWSFTPTSDDEVVSHGLKCKKPSHVEDSAMASFAHETTVTMVEDNSANGLVSSSPARHLEVDRNLLELKNLAEIKYRLCRE